MLNFLSVRLAKKVTKYFILIFQNFGAKTLFLEWAKNVGVQGNFLKMSLFWSLNAISSSKTGLFQYNVFFSICFVNVLCLSPETKIVSELELWAQQPDQGGQDLVRNPSFGNCLNFLLRKYYCQRLGDLEKEKRSPCCSCGLT